MPKFSVKKPLTVFVAVIAVLVLGVVSYMKMTPDLLPNMDFPYVMIMTTYPGATPEKVEQTVTKPMEQSMSTLEHIKSISSTSSENYSMVMLEFEEAVNMDTIGVDIQQQISVLSAAWDDIVGTPYVLKINPSMLPVEVAAVSMEGLNTIELTEFLNDTLMTKLEGIPGVARISTTGMVEQELHVILDQKLLDQTNQKVIDAINGELDEAAEELEKQQKDLKNAKGQMASAQKELNKGADAIVEGEQKLQEEKEKLLAAQEELEKARLPLEATYQTLNALNKQVENVVSAKKNADNHLAALKDLKTQGSAIASLEARIDALEQEIADLEAGTGTQPDPNPEETPEPDPEPEDIPEPDPQKLPENEPAADLTAEAEDVIAADTVAATAGEKVAVRVDMGNGVTGIVYRDAAAEKLSALSDPTVILGQKQAELATLKAELAQKQAAYNAALAASGVTEETLDAAIAIAETNCAIADEAVEAIDKVLESQNTDREGLADLVKQTKEQRDQLLEAEEQLAAGLITMEEAEAMLEQQKLSGMTQL